MVSNVQSTCFFNNIYGFDLGWRKFILFFKAKKSMMVVFLDNYGCLLVSDRPCVIDYFQ